MFPFPHSGGSVGSIIVPGYLTASGLWSMSRDLYPGFSSARHTDVSGDVSSLNDQTSNGRHLSQANSALRPTVTTAGPNSRTCADFDSAAPDRLTGAAVSNFITNSSGYMIVSFIADTITTNSANTWTNHGVLTDNTTGNLGIFLRNTTGSPETAQAFNWDGNNDTAASAVINTGTAYVVEWKHESGNVSLRVNGASWIDVASGNTVSLAGAMTIGTGNGTGGSSLDGKVFEAAVWTTIPSSTIRDAIVADWKTWIGA